MGTKEQRSVGGRGCSFISNPFLRTGLQWGRQLSAVLFSLQAQVLCRGVGESKGGGRIPVAFSPFAEWLAPWNSWDVELWWQRGQEPSVTSCSLLHLMWRSPKELSLAEAESGKSLPKLTSSTSCPGREMEVGWGNIPAVWLHKHLGSYFRSKESCPEARVLIVCDTKITLYDWGTRFSHVIQVKSNRGFQDCAASLPGLLF